MLVQGQRDKVYIAMEVLIKLTKHEQTALFGVLKAHSNAEIARTMNIHEKSVKWHLTKVYKIFDVKSRAQLCSEMSKNGMIVA